MLGARIDLQLPDDGRRVLLGPNQCNRIHLMHGRKTACARQAWTLIEILVVIFILCVLMAILLPILDAAREQGRRVVCQGRLRQLYYAWNQYADDHAGRLIYCLTWRPQLPWTSPQGRNPWLLGRAMPIEPLEALSREDWRDMLGQGALWPYLREVDMYGCPACPSQLRISMDSSGLMNVTKTPIRLSYSISASMGTDGPLPDVGGLPSAGLQRVGQPPLYVSSFQEMTSPGPGARMVFICDGDLRAASAVFYDEPRWHSPPPVYHRDGTTLSFADGHCEYWKWSDPLTLRLGRLARDNFAAYADTAHRGETLTPGNPDMERLQRAMWGGLGYSTESK